MPSYPIPTEPDYTVHDMGRPSGTRLTVFNNGEVEVSGVDYSSKLTVWSLDHRFIVVKASGGMHWSGRGNQSYHGPQFLVFAIKNGPSDAGKYGTSYGVESIVSFEVGRDTKPVTLALEDVERYREARAARAAREESRHAASQAVTS